MSSTEPRGRGEPGAAPDALPKLDAADPSDRELHLVDQDTGGNGVHAITRKTNYWFEREVHVIEKKAEEWAAEWAHKGLPRHDVPRTEPLEPEQVLAKLSSQLFREWQLRVRTKMQDAIEEASQQVGDQVATLRAAVTRLEATQSESADIRERIDRLRAEAERDTRPVRYERFIGGWLFWPAAVILALVEFFANFPVFRLLLPMSSTLAGVARTAAENVDDTSLLAGPALLWREMLMHVEASIVALVAVVILVLLGKTLGGSWRPLRALRPEEHKLAADTIRAHQRQHRLLAWLSFAGLACVLAFLFFSRRGIAETAHDRVTADQAALQEARRAEQTTNDMNRKMGLLSRVRAADQRLQQHQDDAAYATTVQQNNVPILFLNIGLVLAAVVLGFSYKAEDLGEKRGEHPDIAPLRDRLSNLEREIFEIVKQGRMAAGQAHAGISRVHHLVAAKPLSGWESKVMRLESIIPRFRGENARLRGLDPANVRAFDEAPQLTLPPVEANLTFSEPAEFARLKQEFSSLEGGFARVAPRATPAFGLPAIA